jgi:hypothetical protein
VFDKKNNLHASCDLNEVNVTLRGKVSVDCRLVFEIVLCLLVMYVLLP